MLFCMNQREKTSTEKMPGVCRAFCFLYQPIGQKFRKVQWALFAVFFAVRHDISIGAAYLCRFHGVTLL